MLNNAVSPHPKQRRSQKSAPLLLWYSTPTPPRQTTSRRRPRPLFSPFFTIYASPWKICVANNCAGMTSGGSWSVEEDGHRAVIDLLHLCGLSMLKATATENTLYVCIKHTFCCFEKVSSINTSLVSSGGDFRRIQPCLPFLGRLP